uniref:Uncharacterized protein n=1 Tax=Anopheles culicifacies TaxID=139723 RepID=A0A182MD50_9DIPT
MADFSMASLGVASQNWTWPRTSSVGSNPATPSDDVDEIISTEAVEDEGDGEGQGSVTVIPSHLAQRQFRYEHSFLCPRNPEMTPWLRQRAHLGTRKFVPTTPLMPALDDPPHVRLLLLTLPLPDALLIFVLLNVSYPPPRTNRALDGTTDREWNGELLTTRSEIKLKDETWDRSAPTVTTTRRAMLCAASFVPSQLIAALHR